MRPFAVYLTLVALACSHSACAQQVSPNAQKAVETIRQLRMITLPNSMLEEAPPARVPGLLRQLNQHLRALIIEDLNDGTKHSLPGEEEILEQLRTAGWEEISSQKCNAYGSLGGRNLRPWLRDSKRQPFSRGKGDCGARH